MKDNFFEFVYKCILSLIEAYDFSSCKNPEELRALHGIGFLCVILPCIVSIILLFLLGIKFKFSELKTWMISISAFFIIMIFSFGIAYLIINN